MKKFFTEAFKDFGDKCVIKVWEAMLLVFATMCGTMGITLGLIFYGNDISTKFGWLPLVPFAVSNVDDSTKANALIAGIGGLIVYAAIMTVVTGKGRIVKK
jgi:hypothetical protein